MTPAEAERIAAILKQLCGTCNGTGLISVYASGYKDELPENEPCDDEIHDRIPEAAAAIAEVVRIEKYNLLSSLTTQSVGVQYEHDDGYGFALPSAVLYDLMNTLRKPDGGEGK